VRARARVYHQACGLVHRDHRVVLVEDFDRQILRRCSQGWEGGGRHLDVFTATQQKGGLRCYAVHAHVSVFDPALEAGTAVFGEVLPQVVVESLSEVGSAGGK
jgi:hypothetical protein